MQTPDARHETTLTPTELYEGVLLGTAIGDALGLACEGLSAGAIAQRFGRVELPEEAHVPRVASPIVRTTARCRDPVSVLTATRVACR
ncbi:MAG: ADP-ribosylglycohydrolase family protein [Deltaproteobacteria bacterium]